MDDWKIVKSRSGFHQEFGYPLPEILCRTGSDLKEALENSEIHDPEIISYINKK